MFSVWVIQILRLCQILRHLFLLALPNFTVISICDFLGLFALAS